MNTSDITKIGLYNLRVVAYLNGYPFKYVNATFNVDITGYYCEGLILTPQLLDIDPLYYISVNVKKKLFRIGWDSNI